MPNTTYFRLPKMRWAYVFNMTLRKECPLMNSHFRYTCITTLLIMISLSGLLVRSQKLFAISTIATPWFNEAPLLFRKRLFLTWKTQKFSRDVWEKRRISKNFERFFVRLINEIGYEEVLQKYLFDRREIADDILFRMYMGKCPNILDGYQCRYNKAKFSA